MEHTIRVLIADDDREFRDILAEHLSAYRITTGRANLLGSLEPHSAVALGLALSEESEAAV